MITERTLQMVAKAAEAVKEHFEEHGLALAEQPIRADGIHQVTREPELGGLVTVWYLAGGRFRGFTLTADAAQKLGAILVDPEGQLRP